MTISPLAQPEVSDTPEFSYDSFLSYSTRSDYPLAAAFENFAQGFHSEEGVRERNLKPLKICMDGSDFSAKSVKRDASSSDPDAHIKELIASYLLRSASLIVFWPGKSAASPYLNWEQEEFLRQNEANGWDRPLYLVITRGENPTADPENFFSELHLSRGLHRQIFYDFRGYYLTSKADRKANPDVRYLDDERVRLVVDLHNLRRTDNLLAVDDILPAVERAQITKLRRTRTIAVTVAAVTTALAGVAFWQWHDAQNQKKQVVKERDHAEQLARAEAVARQLADDNNAKATKARHDAEQLIGRMQTDIRETLQSLGRMDLMLTIHTAVSEYLRHNASDNSEARQTIEALEESEQGGTLLNMDDPKEALLHYRKAWDLAAQSHWPEKDAWRLEYLSIILKLVELSKSDPTQNAFVADRLKEASTLAESEIKKADPSPDAYVLWSELQIIQCSTDEDRIKILPGAVDRLKVVISKLPEENITARWELNYAVSRMQRPIIDSLIATGKVGDALRRANETANDLLGSPINKALWTIETARALSFAGDLYVDQHGWQEGMERFQHANQFLLQVLKNEPRRTDALQLLQHVYAQQMVIAEAIHFPDSDRALLKEKKETVEKQLQEASRLPGEQATR